jgi:hypothetical protein
MYYMMTEEKRKYYPLLVKKNTQSSSPSVWCWILALFEGQTETTKFTVY